MRKAIEEPAAEADYGGPRAVNRLMALLERLVRAHDGLSLTELAIALDSPKSSVLNLLRPLLGEGYVVHVDARYALGPAAFRLATGIAAAWDFPRLIRPYLAELAERTGETAILGLLNERAKCVSYVDIIECDHPVRYHIPAGTERPILCTAAGKIMLAFGDPAWAAAYLRGTRFPITIGRLDLPVARRAVDKATLLRELEQIRTEGVAISVDRFIKGVSALGAPVFDREGRFVATLTAAGPTERIRDQLEPLAATIRDVARRASGALTPEALRGVRLAPAGG